MSASLTTPTDAPLGVHHRHAADPMDDEIVHYPGDRGVGRGGDYATLITSRTFITLLLTGLIAPPRSRVDRPAVTDQGRPVASAGTNVPPLAR